MSKDSQSWMLYTDGGSRGNPGLAAYAFILIDPAGGIYQEAECIGRMTNNQAEYLALLNGLEAALDLGVENLHVRSDSELMVKQMQGLYQVKNPELREIFLKTKALQNAFKGRVKFEHVRREANKRSDELCNRAMDGQPSPKTRGPALREAFVRVDAGALGKAVAASTTSAPKAAKSKAEKGREKAPGEGGPSPIPPELVQTLSHALSRAAAGQKVDPEELARQIAPWIQSGSIR